MKGSIASQLVHARSQIDSRGELPYRVRVALLRSLDDQSKKDAKSNGISIRRSMLALTCARECAGFWVETDSGVALEPVLKFAEQGLREGNMLCELEEVAHNLRREVDDVLAMGKEKIRAAYSGFSSTAAIWTVLRDECLDDSVESEKTLDVEKWSSAFWASCAFAGGAVWEADVNDDERRSFWTWYLDEAVPSVVMR